MNMRKDNKLIFQIQLLKNATKNTVNYLLSPPQYFEHKRFSSLWFFNSVSHARDIKLLYISVRFGFVCF